jgi:hypothetical protein
MRLLVSSIIVRNWSFNQKLGGLLTVDGAGSIIVTMLGYQGLSMLWTVMPHLLHHKVHAWVIPASFSTWREFIRSLSRGGEIDSRLSADTVNENRSSVTEWRWSKSPFKIVSSNSSHRQSLHVCCMFLLYHKQQGFRLVCHAWRGLAKSGRCRHVQLYVWIVAPASL